MVHELKHWLRSRYYSLIFHLPLRKCRCGGKPVLRSNVNGERWRVECDNYICPRFVKHFYYSPIAAIFMWNFRDYEYFYN